MSLKSVEDIHREPIPEMRHSLVSALRTYQVVAPQRPVRQSKLRWPQLVQRTTTVPIPKCPPYGRPSVRDRRTSHYEISQAHQPRD